MTRTLFLDIDGVLMAHTTQPPSKKLGFTDWRKIEKPRPFGWNGWISDQQLALILDVFHEPENRIVWLTTWEISAYTEGGANQAFSGTINWLKHDCFPEDWLDDAFGMMTGGSGLYVASHWWKHTVVHRAHEQSHEYAKADQIVWVDDDLVEYNSNKAWDMLTEYRSEDTFKLVCPNEAWSRDSIESFRL